MPTLTASDVANSHIIDDLATDLAAANRALSSVRALLATAADAAAAGNSTVAAEYIDRALLAATPARSN
jgi:hypothetical protein